MLRSGQGCWQEGPSWNFNVRWKPSDSTTEPTIVPNIKYSNFDGYCKIIALLESLDQYLPKKINHVTSVWIIRHLPSHQDGQLNVIQHHCPTAHTLMESMPLAFPNSSQFLATLVALQSTLVSQWVRKSEFWTSVASRLASMFLQSSLKNN